MALTLEWSDVAIRLGLATLAGFAIGLNRGEHGHAAGLRTTLLVCLAAAIAMVQANLLMNTVGKKPDSFVVLDLMRFPLGILSGIGFIGAGAIFRRKDITKGVTTAATLWFVTVMGLCFGGGQIGLGLSAFGLAFLTLWLLKHVEAWLPRDQHAQLKFVSGADGPESEEVRNSLVAAGYRIESCTVSYADHASRRVVRYEVRWRGREGETRPPQFIDDLARRPGISRLQWKPIAIR